MAEANSLPDFTDADLRSAMRRAMWFTAVAGVVGCVVLALALSWQTGTLFVVGAVVSVTGIYEWRQLIRVINARMDHERPPRKTWVTVFLFLLRMGFAVCIIYASLRYLHGSFYALVAGLALAALALAVEALRVIRR